MMSARKSFLAVIGVVVAIVWAFALIELPPLAANGLLHPGRRRVDPARRGAAQDVQFEGAGVTLEGWRFAAQGRSRGTAIYLHGVADNRGSAVYPAERLTQRGFDVIAYDSRAHGGSTGDVCTYGYYEKRDLEHVMDTVEEGPIVLIGTSLGAAVALQAAADDRRVDAVVAAESFSDLRTVATERAPWFLTPGVVRRAFAIAEESGQFVVDEVSPQIAAADISVPVLLIHGANDRETRPEHSRRIYEALKGSRQLLLVEGAGHNQSLTAATWEAIERWLDDVMARRGH